MSTPRRGHLALRIPNNNSILLAGGSSNGTPLASAELFIPWTGAFRPTDNLTATRLGATGSAMKRPGTVMLAGGPVNASGEVYVGATVTTDKPDYFVGETVIITGTGWQPGETVSLLVHEVPTTHADRTYTSVVDASGSFTNTQMVVEPHDVGVTFYLTATGLTSGFTAQTTFTDNKGLDLVKAGTGTGTVTSNVSTQTGQSINCNAACTSASAQFGNIETVTLTATASAGSTFAGWAFTAGGPPGSPSPSVGCSTAGPTCSFGMNNNANTVTATFNAAPAHIIVDKVTSPSGDPQSFAFTTTGGLYAGFALTDAATPND